MDSKVALPKSSIALSEEQAFQLLERKIYQEKGLQVKGYRDSYIKRRIAVRMRTNEVGSYAEYIKVLNSSPEEYDLLLGNLTINVTQFFRDESAFEALRDDILPELISTKRKHGQRVVKAWCAGCATGEEPYSVAMLFHLVLGPEISSWVVKVYGTDIDQPSLTKAREGRYEKIASFGGREFREYFDFDGQYKLKTEVKQMVRFSHYDLTSKHWSNHFDLIVCRNVLIYFSPSLQEELLHTFYHCLNEDGYLVLGKTETLLGGSRMMFDPINIRECIYQKLEEAKIGQGGRTNAKYF
jgi:chemotaxis protein methyltransferase CheR